MCTVLSNTHKNVVQFLFLQTKCLRPNSQPGGRKATCLQPNGPVIQPGGRKNLSFHPSTSHSDLAFFQLVPRDKDLRTDSTSVGVITKGSMIRSVFISVSLRIGAWASFNIVWLQKKSFRIFALITSSSMVASPSCKGGMDEEFEEGLIKDLRHVHHDLEFVDVIVRFWVNLSMYVCLAARIAVVVLFLMFLNLAQLAVVCVRCAFM